MSEGGGQFLKAVNRDRVVWWCLETAPRASTNVDSHETTRSRGRDIVVDAITDVGDFYGSAAALGDHALEEQGRWLLYAPPSRGSDERDVGA